MLLLFYLSCSHDIAPMLPCARMRLDDECTLGGDVRPGTLYDDERDPEDMVQVCQFVPFDIWYLDIFRRTS